MPFTPRTWGRPRLRPDRRIRTRRRPLSLRLERLEDRLALSTLTVTNTLDHGPGSLRDAIAAAVSGDSIVFAGMRDGDTITLTSGELTIGKSLDIRGPGSGRLTISGNDVSRVFDVNGGANVAIAGLTIAHGHAVGLGSGHTSTDLGGGGVLNEAGSRLTLTRCVLTQNTATAASGTVDVFGGGLLNVGSAVVVSCTFRGNQALGGGGSSFFGGSVGGAVDNFGGANLTVTGGTFVDNQAIGAPGSTNFGIGGALENNSGFDQSTPATATINRSTFIGNVASGGAQATGNGGAMDNEGAGAVLTLNNTRLIANQSLGGPSGGEGRGGGVMNVFGGILTVQNSLLRDNVAAGGSGAVGLFPNFLDGRGIGGGIDNVVGGKATVVNSTLRGNKALGGDGGTFGGTLATSNVGDGDGGGIDNGDGPGGTLSPSFNGPVSTFVLINSTLIANEARGGSTSVGRGGSGQGGGVINLGTLTVIDATISRNVAAGGSGGAGFQAGFGIGGGLDSVINASASVVGSRFAGNEADGGDGASGARGGDGVGGGVNVGQVGLATDHSSLKLNSSTLRNNGAFGGRGGAGGGGLGGGLAIQIGSDAAAGTVRIERNLAVGGDAGPGIGGGVYALGTFTPDPLTVVRRNRASTSNNNIGP